MTPAEQHLLDYLYQQFPATVGHIPLKEKMRAIRNESLKNAAKSLLDKSVWIPDGAGGWEKAYVNNIIFRTYNEADKEKHPSACVLTDTFLKDVKFEAP